MSEVGLLVYGFCSAQPSPLRTRYSARSVASMSADRPERILSGLILIVEITPVDIWMQSLIESTESNIISHASWKSLLYVVGAPCITNAGLGPCTFMCRLFAQMNNSGRAHLHDSEHSSQVALQPASLSSDQLQRIRILFLRHQAAPCKTRRLCSEREAHRHAIHLVMWEFGEASDPSRMHRCIART